MPRPNALAFLPLLDRALAPEIEIGISIRVTGIERQSFRDNFLYAARKASGDPRYSALIMFLPGGDHTDEIWICKREVELGADA